MNKFTYPYTFSVAMREVFSQRHLKDKPILDALDKNQFNLGGLLFEYKQSIIIDPEYIEYLLTDTVGVMNLEESFDSDLVLSHKMKIIVLRDMLKQKRLVKKLYEEWVAICDAYEQGCNRRVPVAPCVVIRVVESQ